MGAERVKMGANGGKRDQMVANGINYKHMVNWCNDDELRTGAKGIKWGKWDQQETQGKH